MPVVRLEDAIRRARAYAREHGARWVHEPPVGIVDRGDYWFLPVGFIGSAGIIIDKASERLFVMGSSLSQEQFFWGHDNGFSGEKQRLRVTKVRELAKTVEFLFYAVHGGPGSTRDPFPRREWLQEQLRELPRDFRRQPLWLRIPEFRTIREETHWFDFEVTPEEEEA